MTASNGSSRFLITGPASVRPASAAPAGRMPAISRADQMLTGRVLSR